MRPGPTLCRHEGHTCGACCWGEQVSRYTLRAYLRRHTRLARQWFEGKRLPGYWQRIHFELACRHGLDLLVVALLSLPVLGDWLRPRLHRRLVCAFLVFEDAAEQRIGCILHPSRWNNQEVRPESAFALLPGIGCGSPNYYCLSAHWHARASWEERRDFIQRTAGMTWYEYSKAASGFQPQR